MTQMRIITLNTNGIRSAARKGFYEWLKNQRADVVCLQEIKAQRRQLDEPLFHPNGYHAEFRDADKKGYSGVAMYARRQPDHIARGLGWPEFDSEGRYLQMDFGRLSIASIYMPSGTSGDERQSFKYEVMERLKPVLKRIRRTRREHILCGDWNIAHREIDLKNWRSNQKNSGFLPEERAWMDWLFTEAGFADVFRKIDSRAEQYTWWSNRGQAWSHNVGWRIDYQVATPGIAKTARVVHIYKEERFSDHAPLTVEYDYAL